MRRTVKIIFSTLLILASASSQAQDRLPVKADFDRVYQSIVAKIRSEASAEDKVNFIKAKDTEYVSLGKKMMLASDKNPGILKDPDYSYFWELYEKVIPLLKIRLNLETKTVSENSCLEASRLVQASPPEKSEELALGGLALEDVATADLLNRLCQEAR